MRNNTRFLSVLTAVALGMLVVGCTKEGGGGGSDDKSDTGGSSGGARSGSFSSDCGTVVGGLLANPASAKDGFTGPVTVIGSNLLSIKLSSGPILVKLHGLGVVSDSSTAASAQSTLRRLAAEGDATFIPADANCTTTVSGGGVGSIGQLFSPSGKSYSETLINNRLANVSSDTCGGALIASCYRALDNDAASKFAGEVGRLLWKPVSDSNGNLAIHTEPYGTTVVVNGVKGTNQGPGNGYGSLARFSKPGCAYGANVRVQVLDENGAAYTFNGATTITIPNGCNRYCVDGSSLEQCVKR